MWFAVEFTTSVPPPNSNTPPPSPRPSVALSCDTFPPAGTFTIMTQGEAPGSMSNTENAPLVLGLRFVPTQAGSVSAVRFFKSNAEMGSSRSGRIYDSSNGALLGSTGPFSDASCPGPRWVAVRLPTPVRLTAGKEYIVAIDALRFYTKTDNYFDNDMTGGGGLTVYGGASVYTFVTNTMPNNAASGGTSNYWIDGQSACQPSLPHMPGLHASLSFTHRAQSEPYA